MIENQYKLIRSDLMYLSRGLEASVSSALETRPVVILEGARGVGKTRLASHLRDTGVLEGEFFTFADEATFELAGRSPKAFVDELPFGSIIDEAQLVPEIQLQIKRLVDADSRPGRALLTGSVRIAKDQLAGSPPLAGRSATFRLEPFTRSERSGSPTSILEALFAGDPSRLDFVPENQSAILTEAIGGGFPLLQSRSDRQNFIEDALPQAVVGRRSRGDVMETGRLLAAKTSKPYVAERLAKDLGIDKRTVAEYVKLWEDVMLIRRLKNWRPSPGAATRAQQRLHVVDIGLATAWGKLDVDRDRGPLFETLVANELAAQRWSQPGLELFHYREKSEYEVDLILSKGGADELVGIEVKAASEVRSGDFKQLQVFRERSRGRMKYGYVFYSGDTVLPAGDGLWAVPIPVLWGLAPAGGATAEPDLGRAVAQMTAAVRAQGNPSLLKFRLPEIEEETEVALARFVELMTEAVDELHLQISTARSGISGIPLGVDGPFASRRVALISGTATTGQIAIVFEAMPSGSNMVGYSVTLGQRPNTNRQWQVIGQITGERSESDYRADVLLEASLMQFPALTEALAQL